MVAAAATATAAATAAAAATFVKSYISLQVLKRLLSLLVDFYIQPPNVLKNFRPFL